MKFPLAQFLRQCEAIKNGELDSLNFESLSVVEFNLAQAMLRVRAAKAPEAQPRPQLNRQQRHDFLVNFVREKHIPAKALYEVYERHANELKRTGFYAFGTVTADIVRRITNIAEEIQNRGAQ